VAYCPIVEEILITSFHVGGWDEPESPGVREMARTLMKMISSFESRQERAILIGTADDQILFAPT